jgi:hypothetical protein
MRRIEMNIFLSSNGFLFFFLATYILFLFSLRKEKEGRPKPDALPVELRGLTYLFK